MLLTKLFRNLTITLIPLSLLTQTLASYAEIPHKAVVSKIYGRRELWVRRQGGNVRNPAQIGSTLQRYNDTLLVNGNSETHAILRFFSDTNQDLNMYVKTVLHSQSALYHYPCTIRNGAHIFGWGLATRRACEQGLQVIGGNPLAQIPQTPKPFIAQFDKGLLFSQSYPRQIYYCSVLSPAGDSWLGMKSGEPCQTPLETCQRSASQCTPTTMGHWWTNTPEVTANLECAASPPLTVTGSGDDLKDLITQLHQSAIAQGRTDCILQVYHPDDVIVTPADNATVTSQTGDEEIIVKSYDTGACPEISVINGTVLVKSAQRPEGTLVTPGYKSTRTFCQKEQGEIEPFDLEAERRSVDMEVLEADRLGMEFCNQEQASGGQEGDARTIQLTKNQGEIQVDYEMFQVPDRFQVFYEGRELLDTGFISGNGRLSVPFQGTSGRIEVILTGNEKDATTKWKYTISCPS